MLPVYSHVNLNIVTNDIKLQALICVCSLTGCCAGARRDHCGTLVGWEGAPQVKIPWRLHWKKRKD